MNQQRADRPVPASAAAAPRGDGDFGVALGAVFRAYMKALDAVVGDFPGGARGHFILAAAVRGEVCSQRTLCERLGVDRTVMTYLLNDLEQAGLVERRPDPSDRRNWRIGATSAGERRWSELRGPLDAARSRVAELLPEASRAQFHAMLCTLADSAGRLGQAEQGDGASRGAGCPAHIAQDAVDC
ncbi:MarR family winged helix-turn-helix transcriptional regulator [Streptomyces sp. NPDC048305]|uniref:MarR family winged helix-turn-helix transcriptional regulator n=1 Tax=Streptomyces sp. NPDC048305 TaxID=3365532 RepID=UPI0037180B56